MGNERRNRFPKDLTLQLRHEGYLGLGQVKRVLGEGEQQGCQVQGVANGKTRWKEPGEFKEMKGRVVGLERTWGVCPQVRSEM